MRAIALALILGGIVSVAGIPSAQAQVTLYESTGPDTAPKKPARQEDDNSGHTMLDVNADEGEAPTLKEKLKDGTYVYDTKPSPQKEGVNVHFGSYTLNNLQGDTAGVSYQDAYNNTKAYLVTVDYEYQFYKDFGKLGVKGGLGFMTAKGNGVFVGSANAGLTPDTQFTFYAFPISVSPVYHLQFSDRQILVPYAEGGADYFGMLEYRDDKTSINDSIKFGGAAACHWAAGLQIQLDFLDRQGIWNLDHSYGINHLYLTADFRQVIGLSSTFDFSGTIYEGGLFVEF